MFSFLGSVLGALIVVRFEYGGLRAFCSGFSSVRGLLAHVPWEVRSASARGGALALWRFYH